MGRQQRKVFWIGMSISVAAFMYSMIKDVYFLTFTLLIFLTSVGVSVWVGVREEEKKEKERRRKWRTK